MSKTVLITGSTGMVGRNATDKLLEMGFDVLTPTRNELDLIDSNRFHITLSRILISSFTLV